MLEDMEERHTSEADRQELHALVDHIPAGDLPAARKILRALEDSVWQSILSAPLDDEPENRRRARRRRIGAEQSGQRRSDGRGAARAQSVNFLFTDFGNTGKGDVK